MDNAENDAEMQATISMDETQSLLYETGFSTPLAQIAAKDKTMIHSILVNYHCMTKVKAIMDQYMEGLGGLGLLHLVQANPVKWRDFFVDPGVNVDAGE